jgi:hypothetical protein
MSDKNFDNFFGMSGKYHEIISSFEYSPDGCAWKHEGWLSKELFNQELPPNPRFTLFSEISGAELEQVRASETYKPMFEALDVAIFELLERDPTEYILRRFSMDIVNRTIIIIADKIDGGIEPSVKIKPDQFNQVRKNYEKIVGQFLTFLWGYSAQKDEMIADLVGSQNK